MLKYPIIQEKREAITTMDESVAMYSVTEFTTLTE